VPISILDSEIGGSISSEVLIYHFDNKVGGIAFLRNSGVHSLNLKMYAAYSSKTSAFQFRP
jgi:hypothetical protein